MNLLYPNEHFSCKNFSKGKDDIVEIMNFKAGETVAFDLVKAEIIFTLKGCIRISYETVSEMEVCVNHMLFFPPGCRLTITSIDEVKILVCRIYDSVTLCETYTTEDLHKESFKKDDNITILPIHQRFDLFLQSLINSIEDGIRCKFYFENKIKEIFFLLRAYYHKEDLFNLFNPILSGDTIFSNMVWSNYRKIATVSEFAELTNYSLSRFKDKFKEIFSIPASQWMNQQKARNLYYELKFTNKSFEEISEEYFFTSTSYLSTFCKNNLSMSPSEIRTMRHSCEPSNVQKAQ